MDEIHIFKSLLSLLKLVPISDIKQSTMKQASVIFLMQAKIISISSDPVHAIFEKLIFAFSKFLLAFPSFPLIGEFGSCKAPAQRRTGPSTHRKMTSFVLKLIDD